MKKTLILLSLIGFVACQKKIAGPSQPDPVITNAQMFFTRVLSQHLPINSANYRANQVRVPAWGQAEVRHLSVGMAVVVPVTFQNKLYVVTNLAGSYIFDLSQVTKLVIFQDALGQYRHQVLTLIPDSSSILHPGTFTGIALTEDWSGNSLIGPQRIGQLLTVSASSPRPVMVDDMLVSVCTEIDGYNYAVGDATNGEAWEETSCTTYDIGDGGSDASYSSLSSGDYSAVGGGGGGAKTILIAPPNNIISSLPNYFSCFTNVGGNDHSYSVSVCVDQPDPGTRTPWTVQDASGSSANNNPVNSGHVFLILTESSGGTTITRNIGFYPATKVSPFSQASATAGGVYNNDQAHEFNISGTMTLTNSQFFQILNYCEDNSTMTYDLNTNNCTTFVLNAMAQTGINLPRTIGYWPGGSGDDPGDLGEDIRTRNIPGMTVNTSPASNHMNVGICYP